MSSIVPVSRADWSGPGRARDASAAATKRLERGDVLLLADAGFQIQPDEAAIFSPAILSSSKNASFDPRTGRVGGTTLAGAEMELLHRLMARFSDAALDVVRAALPGYAPRLERARASFRPAEIAGRQTTWRKDDTRLHVDAFPASPVQGRRILRLFTNVNPEGRARVWRVGTDFEAVAARFAGALKLPPPGWALVLRALGVTKTRRSGYDALMLQLHDRMKEDSEFQATTPQATFDFPSGTTWLAFTDQVSHAAVSGQYQLEQTFYLSVGAMMDDSLAPLRVLERIKGRKLA